nr:hypothetical protein [Tanacetum cinerariifolium]
GTSNGTATGADGTYSLSVPGGNGTLIFSFVGYVKREVPLNGKTSVSLSLDPDENALDDVPGAELQIRVRGAASINASNEPLYVVDGVPVDNLRGINPTDVANIEVLKDAASAAIYGSRGSNGVVLVTTKRGRKGAARLQFSGFTGLQKVESKLKVQSAEEWIQMRKEGIDLDWLAQNPLNRADDSRATRLARLTVNGVPPSTTNVIRYTYDPKWAYGQDSLAYTDWQDALFRKASMQQYTVGVSGGTDNVTYNINGSYLDQDGVVIALYDPGPQYGMGKPGPGRRHRGPGPECRPDAPRGPQRCRCVRGRAALPQLQLLGQLHQPGGRDGAQRRERYPHPPQRQYGPERGHL